MSDTDLIRYAEEGALARITLARPPLNILTTRMMEDLGAAVDRAAGSPRLKVLLLDAVGKAFSAGVAVEDHVGDRLGPMLDAFHGIFRRLHGLDVVTMAAVQGAALGGGAELATFCDVVVASDRATFGQPEIKVGVFPPIAALSYPARIGVPRTLRLLCSGEIVGAAAAERMGLIDRVVPADDLAGAVAEEVTRYTAQSAVVLRLTKRAVRQGRGDDFDESLSALEELYRGELMATEDAEEGLRAFMGKRAPVWRDR